MTHLLRVVALVGCLGLFANVRTPAQSLQELVDGAGDAPAAENKAENESQTDEWGYERLSAQEAFKRVSQNEDSDRELVSRNSKSSGYNTRDVRPAANEIVNASNDNSSEMVVVDVDRKNRVYEDGENVVVSINSSVDGYLYLVNVNSNGKATLLFPNQFEPENRIVAKTKTLVPSANAKYHLGVGGPSFGEEMIRAFVTKEPLQSDVAKNAGDFASLSDAQIKELMSELNAAKSKDLNVKVNGGESASNLTTGEIAYRTAPQGSERPSVRSHKATRYAICIGINDFQDKNINPLKASNNDAKAFRSLCVDSLGVPENNCILLTEKRATLAEIEKTFCKVLPQVVHSDDCVFIFWSGHGGQAASTKSGSRGEFEQFLVPYDGDLSRPFETMLTEDAFGKWIAGLKGCKIAIFLDACHSGGMAANAKSIVDSDAEYVCTFGFSKMSCAKSLGQNDLFVLASSAYNELSFESDEDNANVLSAMTKYLVDAIRKGAPGMTHKELKPLIEPQVKKYVASRYNNIKQTVVQQDDLNPGLVLKP